MTIYSDCPKCTGSSVTKLVQEAGFDTFQNFLLSYGLKTWNQEDVEEGKAILHAFHAAGTE
jgi:hypothetical protein